MDEPARPGTSCEMSQVISLQDRWELQHAVVVLQLSTNSSLKRLLKKNLSILVVSFYESIPLKISEKRVCHNVIKKLNIISLYKYHFVSIIVPEILQYE